MYTRPAFRLPSRQVAAAPRQVAHRSMARRSMYEEGIRQLSVSPTIYFTGHSITIFTMIYCGLNWIYYRSLGKYDKKVDKEDD